MLSENEYKKFTTEKKLENIIEQLAVKTNTSADELKKLHEKFEQKERKNGCPDEELEEEVLIGIESHLRSSVLESSEIDKEGIEKIIENHQSEQEKLFDKEQSNSTTIPEYSKLETPKFYKYTVFLWGNRYYMKISTSPLSFFVLDKEDRKIETLKVMRKEKDKVVKWIEYDVKLLARFSVDKIYEYQPLYSGIAPSYEMTILRKNKNPIKLTPGYLEEIVAEIKGHGGVLRRNRSAMDTIQDLIGLAVDAGFLVEKIDPPQDGFFYIKNKLISTVDFDYPSATEVREALELLNDFSKYYTEFLGNLGYILHWEIMAPFSFAKKQCGSSDKLGALYLFGSSRAGKTIIALLAAHIWNRSDIFLGAGSLHSEASYGRNISQHTFPVIFDEGARIFTDKKTQLPEVFKNSILYPTARGRYNPNSGKYENIPSLSAPIITSNEHEPRSAALGARLKSLEFLLNNSRKPEEMKEFNKKFDPEKIPGPLTKLKAIGEYTAHHMLDNPKLIEKDWEKLSKEIWESIYEYAGVKMPVWMEKYESAAGLQEAWDEESNEIHTMFRKLTLRNAQPTPLYNKSEHKCIPVTILDKIEDVLFNSRETWIYYFKPKTGINSRKKFVEIDAGICKDMMKEFHMDISLKILANDLGGKMITVKHGSKSVKVARWGYNDFIKLLGGVLPGEENDEEPCD